MDIHIVTAVSPAGRYVDSYWVSQKAATRRAEQLVSTWEGLGYNVEKYTNKIGWKAFVTAAQLEDGALEPRPEAAK